MRVTRLLAALAGLLAAAGCNPYDTLPANRAPVKPRSIPAGAECVYTWKATSRTLKTYWDDQQLTLVCRGHFPRAWRRTGDEAWEVSAVNQDGVAVPCLGVLRRSRDARGREQTEILPPVDLEEVRDGLYLLMDTAVKLSGDPADRGTIPREIRPTALLIEIRGHCVKSFQVDIPLVPENPGDLTPAPQISDQAPPGGTPQGTPVPVR